MCGFAGFIDLTPMRDEPTLARIAAEMAQAVRARGPDDGQVWTDPAAGFAVGFRRLAIIDLTPTGRQPMVSADDRFVIVYNGELYNTDELRRELSAAGVRFRGVSDTEVVLEGCALWGVDALLRRLNGMFAAALWDRRDRRLTLFRDHIGIKPLYWGRVGRTIFFGSQPKSFFRHPEWVGSIDPASVESFTRFGYVATPRSIFAGVEKLKPGGIVTIERGGKFKLGSFWDVRAAALAGVRERRTWSDGEAVDALEGLLRDAVKRQMVSDVPLGAFLSGGVDSSTVVALMQAQSARPITTFSIGFTDQAYNEAPFAKAVAAHLGTDHHELYVEPEHAIDVIPDIPGMYDEPFADSSQIPTFIVSRLARERVTVALSGDGGDELFAGYSRYAYTCGLMHDLDRIPGWLRRPTGVALRRLGMPGWARLGPRLLGATRADRVPARLNAVARELEDGAVERLYRDLVSHWHDHSRLYDELPRDPPKPAVGDFWAGSLATALPDLTERMQLIDLMTYLPDDILTKVDRASMATSLETRVPLLDPRVIEFAWRLDPALRVRGDQTKWILRQVLYRHVPKALIERPKMGFGVPIGEWMRGPLRDWAEALLDPKRLREEGWFNAPAIRARWDEHLSGAVNWQYPLWVILMFQAWTTHWSDAIAPALSSAAIRAPAIARP